MIESIIDYEKIGQRIKKQRKSTEVTQDSLAEKLNISTFYLSKIENGKAHATLEMLAMIANSLELDIAFLISGTSKLDNSYYINELESIYKKANKKQMNLIIALAKTVLLETQ